MCRLVDGFVQVSNIQVWTDNHGNKPVRNFRTSIRWLFHSTKKRSFEDQIVNLSISWGQKLAKTPTLTRFSDGQRYWYNVNLIKIDQHKPHPSRKYRYIISDISDKVLDILNWKNPVLNKSFAILIYSEFIPFNYLFFWEDEWRWHVF